MCSAPMFVANSEAPTMGQVSRRPARKNSSLLPDCLARIANHKPARMLTTRAPPPTNQSSVESERLLVTCPSCLHMIRFPTSAGNGRRIAALRVGMDRRRALGGQLGHVAGVKAEIRGHRLVPGDDLSAVDGRPAHHGRKVGEGGPPGFVVRPVVADGLQQHFPLGMIGTDSFPLGFPGDVIVRGVLVLVDAGGRGVNVAGKLGGALGPMDVSDEIVDAVGNVAAGDHRLRAVGEGVLDRVAIEVLAAIGAAAHRPPTPWARNRPGVLDPAALVDLVDHQLDEDAAGGPEELVGMAGRSCQSSSFSPAGMGGMQ